MMEILEKAAKDNGLVAAFAVVGLVMMVSGAVSRRLTSGRVQGSAIAILIGLAMAYVGGKLSGGTKGLADVTLFSGIGLMGGNMLRDFAIVATAFEVHPEEARRAGWIGLVALLLGTVLPFAVGVGVASAFGYKDVVSLTTIGAGAVTYIVGPVTGTAIGASSDVIALSIATGVIKAILVMVFTPAAARFLRLKTPRSAMVFGGPGRDGERRERWTRRDGSEARPLRCARRDVPHRHRMPARAIALLPRGQGHDRTLNMPELPLIARARSHSASVAYRVATAAHTYHDLLDRSATLAAALLRDEGDLGETRVALLVPPGFEFTAAQWAIWRAGGIKVPLCLSGTAPEWEYALTDSGAGILMADAAMAAKISPQCERLGVRLVDVESATLAPARPLPEISPDRRAMILYTSGTTSKPKGVVTTHANIQSQIESLVTAWEWAPTDRIPSFLPLHHIHGIINITGCSLWSGATIEPFSRFDAATILDRVRADSYTVFMAVPTIYVKLIQALEAASPADLAAIVGGFARMRLIVSGSAALPASLHERWTALTGQKLLERYGMTEIGMALSNPYHGERRPGAVGGPLPGVEVRLKAESGAVVTAEDEPGEIQVRGPGVFRAYWNRREESDGSFEDGWFRTGDMAVLERGYYRIMGRLSVDIIKSGGYKLSALEIEAALLEHPEIAECAIIGLPDDTWGEAVAAVVVLKGATSLDLPTLREWCKGRLSVYKIPQRLLMAEDLPRNAMGKVTKPAVRKLFGS